MNLTIFVIILAMGILRTIFFTSLLFLCMTTAAQQNVLSWDNDGYRPIVKGQEYSHTAEAQLPKFEYRAVWLTTIENLDWPKEQARDSEGFRKQREELTTLLDSLQAMRINTVLLQTRVRGDVIYPSRIEPFAHLFTGRANAAPDYDPLAFAIEECHKRGMQLHAWIVTLPLGKDDYVRRQGKHALSRRKRSLCTQYKGQWYMEPGNPETAEYITEIVKEIVRNYDVDGIHLDYVRYPDRTNGYPDWNLHRKHGKGLTLADWRRRNITEIVRAVHKTVKQQKPWVRVSCAPLGKYDNLTRYSSYGWDAYNAVYQEAQEWMEEGIMDILFPMLYFDGNNFYPFVLDWQENSHGRHIVPGIGIYRLLPEYGGWPALEIERQINTSRSAGTAGSAMFRADQTIGCGSAPYSKACSTAALVPPMEWAPGEAPAAPAHLQASRDENGVTLKWSAAHGKENEPPLKYNIYCAIGEDIDIDNTGNLTAHSLKENGFVWQCRTLRAVTVAVTAVDAYGRESAPAIVTCGNNSSLATNEIELPEGPEWGARVEVVDMWGRRLYNGRYYERIGVRGLESGYYRVNMYDRHGSLLYSHIFQR